MIFSRRGYPGVLTGEFGYFQAVLQVGLVDAHRQMLLEAKDWLEEHKPYLTPMVEAVEAYQVHRSFTRLVLNDRETPGALREVDRIFIEVFGFSGRAVLEGNLPKATQVPENSARRRPQPSFRMRARAEVGCAVCPN